MYSSTFLSSSLYKRKLKLVVKIYLHMNFYYFILVTVTSRKIVILIVMTKNINFRSHDVIFKVGRGIILHYSKMYIIGKWGECIS